MPLKVKTYGKSDKGLVRAGNEDCLHLDEKNFVFAVCDGMGGHQAGEVASMLATDFIHLLFDNFKEELNHDPTVTLERTLPASGDVLVKSIRMASRAIYNKAVTNEALAGMGTTIVAVALEDDLMSVAHVGDSRAYLIGPRGLIPLTIDHSWVAEMQQNHKISEEEATSVVGKNVITRALGVRETVEVDYRLVRVKPGGKYLLCSDGLCGFADDDEIYEVIQKAKGDNVRIVDDLIQMANDRGGSDNVTVVLVEMVEVKESILPEVEVFTVPPESPTLLSAQDLWIDKINDFVAAGEKKSPEDYAPKEANKSILFLIFAAFIIVAAIIIYIATQK